MYLLFSGFCYYPSEGWDDFQGRYDTFEEAERAAKALKPDPYKATLWWQIVDLHTPRIVARGTIGDISSA